MFPEDISKYLNDYRINETENVQTPTTAFNGKSFLFDFQKGDFVLRDGKPIVVEGKEALKVWIEKLIRTERFRFKIYENVPYGVTIEDLIGLHLPHGFIESEMRRELTEAILKNAYIQNIKDWAFIKADSKWTIRFKIVSIYDEFEMEVAA